MLSKVARCCEWIWNYTNQLLSEVLQFATIVVNFFTKNSFRFKHRLIKSLQYYYTTE